MTDTIPDEVHAKHADELRVNLALANSLEDNLAAARAQLGAAILAARAAGMTVPAVADVLGWSEANVFRVSAKARRDASPNGK